MIRDGWIPDATSLNDFRRCPEMFRLRHVKGLRRRKREEAPAAGQAWHSAMELWFADEDAGTCLDKLREGWPEKLIEGEEEKRPLSLFERLFEAYCEKYPREHDPFEVVHNEEYIEGVIDNVNRPFKYCGIVDRKIGLGDSQYVMDSKTTSGWLNRDYFEAYEINQQQMGYCALELVNGRECDGYYIDAVHVDTRYKKVKDTDFIRHGPIKLANWQLDTWARDTESTLHQLEWFWDRFGPDTPWEHREQGCRAWNKWCTYWSSATNRDFAGICRSPVELHESLIGEFDVEYWEPKEKANG